MLILTSPMNLGSSYRAIRPGRESSDMESLEMRDLDDEGVATVLPMTMEQHCELPADRGATPTPVTTLVTTPDEIRLQSVGRKGGMPTLVRGSRTAATANYVDEALEKNVNADGTAVDVLIDETGNGSNGNGNDNGNGKSVNLALGRRLLARDLGRNRIADLNAGWTTV